MHLTKLAVLPLFAGGLLAGCSVSPRPNPNQAKPLSAEYVNPHPPGTYAYFTAEPSYPKTSKIYRNHGVLDEMSPTEARVTIDLGLQRAFLFRGEDLAMDYPVSSGRSSFPTPPGDYQIVEKLKEEKRSNLYGTIYDAEGGVHKTDADLRADEVPEGGTFEGASMPYWMRLTWDGVGMHQGRVPRYPASHGCIRTPSSAASTIFSKTRVGTPVNILP
jgi:lipoprotein-anchoring transpeptidase ErfK/SrfK